jgi:hypothetical protein
MSSVIDRALDRIIRAEELRRDIAAYTRLPADDSEVVSAHLPVAFDLGDDDVGDDARYRGRG